jgi:hypothetical protein
MANFQSHPGRANINGTELVINGASVVVGLYGPKDFDGNDLHVTNSGDDLVIGAEGDVGDVRLYRISVKQSVKRVKVEVSDTILAITDAWQTWSQFRIKFRFQHTAPQTLTIRPITSDIAGPGALFRGDQTKLDTVIDVSTFRAGDRSNAPKFLPSAPKPTRTAVFAARYGRTERAYLLICPANSRPSNLLIVITHVFNQSRENHEYYSSLGYSNPLSSPLIRDIYTRFGMQRWGGQLMAATDNYALLLPVRALSHGEGELGAFVTQPRVGARIVGEIWEQSGRAFGIERVDVATFSSGIYDCNAFVATGGRGLPFSRGYNQDPAGASALSSTIGTRKQYLSGKTGAAKGGFEFMPVSRWINEPNYAAAHRQEFNYLHNHCLPNYTLYLALKT